MILFIIILCLFEVTIITARPNVSNGSQPLQPKTNLIDYPGNRWYVIEVSECETKVCSEDTGWIKKSFCGRNSHAFSAGTIPNICGEYSISSFPSGDAETEPLYRASPEAPDGTFP